ncbi:hypothetical protein LOZ63_006611 [Ophidiomyces ophidiicola]|nr:hypothetical protein LOZ63_006611 [Ophidiomyces ophidiicola]
MSAVAAPPVANGTHDVPRDPRDANIDQSPSRFTAVNGREPPASLMNGLADAHLTHRHERESSAESRRASGPQKPHEPPAAASQAELRRNSTVRSPSLHRHKRKRSNSDDPQASPSSSNQSMPISPSSKADDSATPHPQPSETNGMSRVTMTPESEIGGRHSQRPYTPADRMEESQMSSHRPAWDSQHSAHGDRMLQPMDSSDAQIAEALQREAQNHDSQTSWNMGPNGIPGESMSQHLAQLAPHSQNQVDMRSKSHSQPQLQPQPMSQSPSQNDTPPQSQASSNSQGGPKRKRVFSNRTKTGCMTCRRRKKKCDEQHPACNNCIRGNFPCEGYSVRSTWQKPSNPKGPVPLQSKGNFGDVSHPFTHEMSPQQHDARVPPTVLPDNSKPRPVPVDEADRAAAQYISSPPGPGSRGPWGKNSWSSQGPTTYLPDGPPKPEFRDSQGLKELSRAEQPKPDYQMVHQPCDLTHNAHPKPGMPVFQPGMEQRQGPPPRIDPANYSAQARMALNMEPHITFDSPPKTEKEKMLSGEPYRPSDPQLVQERERCKTALWRYTNAGNPIYGISATESTRLLKEILMPTPETQLENIPPPPPTTTTTTTTKLGPGAVVEAPFKCHYGYNISVGEDVLISENCFFSDDCPITIGAHTWIGPNVTILSSMAIGSMQERKGSQSRYQGRPVVIAEDCWIGAGCTILPGVTLGRGAYIAPGEIVRSQILPYGFQGLKPNYP